MKINYNEVDLIKWSNKYHKDLKKGYYTCLVDFDGYYKVVDNEYYNGNDWCWYKSNAQFISYVDIKSFKP